MVFLILFFAAGSVAEKKKPSILITRVPHAGSGPEQVEIIGGTVTGIDFKKYREYKIVVYARAGGQWWVQPTVKSPLTSIDTNGKWETDTHLGSMYGAVLVKPSFKPASTLDSLPDPDPDGEVVAVTRVNALPL